MEALTEHDKLRVEIWSDVVCPWCYIGKRRFERGLAAFPERDRVEVVYRSFQLDPLAVPGQRLDTVERLASRYHQSEARIRAMLAQVEQTAAAEGLEFHLERAGDGNTFDAHRVLHLAAERGLADAVWERFYRAHFTEGRSVFDRESLVRLAAEAELDPDDVRCALAEEGYADRVEADRYEASALGSSGVPFFVIDRRYGISGAQPAEVFTQALARAWAERRPVRPIVDLTAPSADEHAAICTDDGCTIPATGAPIARAAHRGRP